MPTRNDHRFLRAWPHEVILPYRANSVSMPNPQPYLFPENSQFGRDNLVLHATARRHAVRDFHGPLSIKSVVRGEVSWFVNDRALLVDANSFLILNDGQIYSMDIDAAQPVETYCAFFQSGFVEQVGQDMRSSLQSSLDAPFREAPPLRFQSRLHLDTRGLILPQLWSVTERCIRQLQPSSFEEEFLMLSRMLLSLQDEIAAQIARVPAAKASTREELFRRLQVAREYLHGNADRSISLEEVSREACVSRYHLHRAFKQVIGQTPHAYLTTLRLARAHALLQSGEAVTNVAMQVGFSSLSAFTRVFRDHYGYPPSTVPKFARSDKRPAQSAGMMRP
jgi:AraC family transcriptional regulator